MKKNRSSRFGCLARIGHVFLWLVIILALLLVAGNVYQRQAAAADFEQFPAPGQHVNVGGFSLHIHCTGEGSPTVVVDAGNGDFSVGWSGIQPEVAKSTRICTYDRAGYGWSEPSPNPRIAKAMAEELHTLLVNAGIRPPYVLVGHSLGGHNVRMFANLYPDEVAGIVLVDPAHPQQFQRLPPEYVSLDSQQKSYVGVMAFMARFGILRLLGNASQGKNFAPPAVLKMPEEFQPVYMAMMSHPDYFDATLDELNALPETNIQVQGLGGLGDIPLIVLTAEQSIDTATLKAMGYDTQIDLSGIQQVWLELQNELAALSSNSEHTIVKGSSHAIQLDQPAAVIEAILKMVELPR